MLAKPQGFPRKLGGCAGLDPRLRSAVSAGVGDGERGLRRGLRAPGVGVRPKWVLEYSPSNKRIRYFVSITYVRTGLWTAHKFCGGGESLRVSSGFSSGSAFRIHLTERGAQTTTAPTASPGLATNSSGEQVCIGHVSERSNSSSRICLSPASALTTRTCSGGS